jgi:hypothetical protein
MLLISKHCLFYLRDNLDWLARATNWAKFTATASLGVIHKVSQYQRQLVRQDVKTQAFYSNSFVMPPTQFKFGKSLIKKINLGILETTGHRQAGYWKCFAAQLTKKPIYYDTGNASNYL